MDPAIQVSIGDHAAGQQFVRGTYDVTELTRFVRHIAKQDAVWFSARVLVRLTDLKLNPLEVLRAVAGDGEVLAYELGPSRSEMRLEIGSEEGDIRSHRVVVWLDQHHKLHAEDVR